MKPDELRKLEAYLNRTFRTSGIQVKAMPRKKDTAEIYVGEDFVGTVGKDTDEGETSYHVTITVLDIDLD